MKPRLLTTKITLLRRSQHPKSMASKRKTQVLEKESKSSSELPKATTEKYL